MKITIIKSRFNKPITDELVTGCLTRLKEKNISSEDIQTIEVPGAVEIPLMAQHIAKHKKADAIIALGCVIRGETTHYDYVCQMVADGCLRVSLDFHLPVIFGVLTTENKEQALDRLGGKKGHKGADAADAALEMVSLIC